MDTPKTPAQIANERYAAEEKRIRATYDRRTKAFAYSMSAACSEYVRAMDAAEGPGFVARMERARTK